METELEKAMRDLTFRMRLIKAGQEEQVEQVCLTEREMLILELLSENSEMAVSQLSAADPTASDSTISSTITKLWRNKKMVTKTISPENQRTTIIGLTDKGRDVIESLNKQQNERFQKFIEAINVTPDEKMVMLNVFKRANRFFDNHLRINNHYKKEAEPIKMRA